MPALTGCAAVLDLANEDAQAVLRAAAHAEPQLPIRALLHRDGINYVALVAVGCGDTAMTHVTRDQLACTQLSSTGDSA